MIRAKCCQPVPGDEVVGYMTRGKGIALHRHGCPNVAHYQQTEPERLIEVDWKPDRHRPALLDRHQDRTGGPPGPAGRHRQAVQRGQDLHPGHPHPLLPNHTAVMQISFDATDTDHINAMITRLQRLTDVMDIHRLGANEDPVD